LTELSDFIATFWRSTGTAHIVERRLAASIAKDMCNAFEKATMSWAHAGAVACESVIYNKAGILGFKLRC
jgi:hypothetical protein